MKIWIDWENDDESDSDSARWGSVSDEQIVEVLASAVTILGEPDTIA
jgi:hypothetical protein